MVIHKTGNISNKKVTVEIWQQASYSVLYSSRVRCPACKENFESRNHILQSSAKSKVMRLLERHYRKHVNV